MLHPYLADSSRPRILAHRGLTTPAMHAAGIVENSRAAIEAAIDAGSDIVETDCHLTLDGEVVLFHDADLARVTGDPRKIADVTLAELAAIMAEQGGVITLGAALAAYPTTRFNVDVKAGAAAEQIGQLVAPHAHRVLLTSFADAFRTRALAAAAAAEATGAAAGAAPAASIAEPADPQPAIRRAPAASPGQRGVIRILLAVLTGIGVARALRGFDALQIPERQGPLRVLTPRLLRAAHRHGVEVHVWTVNDPDQMRALIDLGVDGIVTDRADVAIEVLRPQK
ncbi:glycerophosphoryl diester phosphodiesterase [Leucobacter exalbidus]|uniref:Glycerophosphoryl diester phosphodiesterase n=1 Tax=Leucobacter exalbidus TaxID=662960 RepID=A0A940PLQ2_9MICO|nr:glycerophosphodiester phosphodiesterase family protein [Leucobacter exalbidus]MBP1325403.1 glycerophosphoryl diester phosphodiesterase [Leucobacter exalbidus]